MKQSRYCVQETRRLSGLLLLLGNVPDESLVGRAQEVV